MSGSETEAWRAVENELREGWSILLRAYRISYDRFAVALRRGQRLQKGQQ